MAGQEGEADLMDDDEKKALQDIVDKIHRDVQLPPYNNNSGRGYSRDYQKYVSDDESELEQTSYEQLCIRSNKLLKIKAKEGTRNKLSPPLRLLDWEITPSMVLSASIGVGLVGFITWIFLLIGNTLLGGLVPNSLILIGGIVPFAAAGYTFYKPIYAAKNKVINSSGEMILSILYMVVYMRSSPNLEGAIRFAALNLTGPIAKDLKGVLWDVEIGNYSSVAESLHEYTNVWKDYNEDYLQSLQLLEAAMNDPNKERREEMLKDAIDNILDGTEERMKHYAQNLKTPVMILNALGAMLPVLGMIMLPLISVFMGGVITSMHLFILFNLMLPATLYWFMQQLLTSRPPTTSTKPVDKDSLPPQGKYKISMFGVNKYIPTWPIGLTIFLVLGAYGILGYLIFPEVYPRIPAGASIPGIFGTADNPNPMTMLLRSISITSALGLGIGVSKLLGSRERRKAEESLKKIENQFPRALFQLGNKIAGGTPVELALEDAADATKQLEISGLFEKSSRNIRNLGMTFEQSLFDSAHGSLKAYPSQLIRTVMKAVLESSEKGTSMAAMAMLTVSRYLQSIHKTQEQLNDLLEDSTTTIVMLAYLLAPVVSGVAVGMSQTIMTAMFKLSQSFQQTQNNLPQSGTGASAQFGILGNIEGAIPPEILQFVVGIYLIQLLYILGTFYMKIVEGDNPTYRDAFIGKVMIVGVIFYTLVVILVGLMFGGVVQSIAV